MFPQTLGTFTEHVHKTWFAQRSNLAAWTQHLLDPLGFKHAFFQNQGSVCENFTAPIERSEISHVENQLLRHSIPLVWRIPLHFLNWSPDPKKLMSTKAKINDLVGHLFSSSYKLKPGYSTPKEFNNVSILMLVSTVICVRKQSNTGSGLQQWAQAAHH